MSDFDEVVRLRRSVRGFVSDRPVPTETLQEALEAAQWSPSNCNVQPWRVFIASGSRRDTLSDKLSAALDSGNFGSPEDAIDSFPDDYRRLQIECGATLYGAMSVARDDHAGRLAALRRNYELFDAPHVAVVCMEKHFGMGVALDVGMWVQTFMLALQDRGIASCPQAALRHYPNIIRESLGIRDSLRILCGISFGYEDVDVPANTSRQKREPIAHNVTFLDA